MGKGGYLFLLPAVLGLVLAIGSPAQAEDTQISSEQTLSQPSGNVQGDNQQTPGNILVPGNNAAEILQMQDTSGGGIAVTDFPKYKIAQNVVVNGKGEQVGEITINGEVVLRVRSQLGDLSIPDRTQIICRRLQDYLAQEAFDPASIRPREDNGAWVVYVGDKPLVMIDAKSVEVNNTTDGELAFCWANRLRTVLGVRPIVMKVLAERTKASFYDTGRPTAGGGIYGSVVATAAHRSLPYGTMVLVSNLETRRSTIVKITDRGPFILGRELDLSRGAARTIGSLGHGIYDVKLFILGQN